MVPGRNTRPGDSIAKHGVGLVDKIIKILKEYPLDMECSFEDINDNKYAIDDLWAYYRSSMEEVIVNLIDGG